MSPDALPVLVEGDDIDAALTENDLRLSRIESDSGVGTISVILWSMMTGNEWRLEFKGLPGDFAGCTVERLED